MIDHTANVPLSASQIRFLMDMMMGCPMGRTNEYAYHYKVSASATYNQLLNCLPTDPQQPE